MRRRTLTEIVFTLFMTLALPSCKERQLPAELQSIDAAAIKYLQKADPANDLEEYSRAVAAVKDEPTRAKVAAYCAQQLEDFYFVNKRLRELVAQRALTKAIELAPEMYTKQRLINVGLVTARVWSCFVQISMLEAVAKFYEVAALESSINMGKVSLLLSAADVYTDIANRPGMGKYKPEYEEKAAKLTAQAKALETKVSR